MIQWATLPTSPGQSDDNDGQDLLGEIGGEIRVALDRWPMGQIDAGHLAAAGIVFAVAAIIAWLLSRLARRYARRFDGGPARASVVSAGIIGATGVVLVGAALALEILGFSLGPVLVIILIAVMLTLLVRPLLSNLSSGLLLHARGVIEAGNLVATNDAMGVVHEVNARSVIIDTSDGRRIHIPNSHVAVDTVANFSELKRRRSSCTFSVDHRVALDDLIAGVAEAIRNEPAVLDDPPPEIDLDGILGRFVIIRVLVWHVPGTADQRHAIDAAVRAIVSTCTTMGIALEGPEVLAVTPATTDRRERAM